MSYNHQRHNNNSQWEERKISWRANENSNLTRGKTRVTKSWLVLVLHLIGWERGASFLDQSQSKVTQNRCNPRLLSKLNWKLLCRQKQFLSIQNCETEFSAKISCTCVLTSTWCSPFVSTRVLVENKLRSAKEFTDCFSVSVRTVWSIKLCSHSQLKFCVFFFFVSLSRVTDYVGEEGLLVVYRIIRWKFF